MKIEEGNASLDSNSPTNILYHQNNYITLEFILNGIPNGKELLKIEPKNESIYNKYDLTAISEQKNNIVKLNNKTLIY